MQLQVAHYDAPAPTSRALARVTGAFPGEQPWSTDSTAWAEGSHEGDPARKISFQKFSFSSCVSGRGGGGRGGREWLVGRSMPQAAEEALDLHRKLGDRNGEASDRSIEV